MANSKLKIVAVIQARLGSTRLPKKVLKTILGKTLIEWIAYRLGFCKEVDQVVLSTVDTKENDVLVNLAKAIGLKYFRGSEMDLVSRFYNTAKNFSADAVVRITGDCPLVDPKIVDLLISKFRKQPSLEYVTNVLPPTFPHGLDVEVISLKALKRLDQEVKDKLHREWITTILMENPDKYKVLNVRYKKNISHLRLTVDYLEDFKLVEIIFKELHKKDKIFGLEEILDLLKRKPELVEINKKWQDNTLVNKIRSKAFNDAKNATKKD